MNDIEKPAGKEVDVERLVARILDFHEWISDGPGMKVNREQVVAKHREMVLRELGVE